MASLPGARFNISGASGSQGLLSPSSSWRCYVFPRGGFASSSSSGTTITFDSAAVASRFTANNWIQVGLDIASIRKVSAVGGNSISVSGSAVTVTLNDRVLVIGNTQPTTVGSSATYIVPLSTIYQRDDDASTTFTNSMITTDSQGLVQFFGGPAVFDCLIQDGNQTNQGLIIDLPVGAVEGVSTSLPAIFGATVTALMGVSVNGPLYVGQSVTIHGAAGITGNLLVGGSLTVNGAVGVTGWATFGSTVTMGGAAGITGTLAVGATATVTGNLVLGQSLSLVGGISQTGFTGTNWFSGNVRSSLDIIGRHYIVAGGGILTSTDCFLSSGWGNAATITPSVFASDVRGSLSIGCTGSGITTNPTFGFTFTNPFSSLEVAAVIVRGNTTTPVAATVVLSATTASVTFATLTTPVAGSTYNFMYLVMG